MKAPSWQWGPLGSPIVFLMLMNAAGCTRRDLDEDGDGVLAERDCDDDDPAVYPGADEIPYDPVDQNCDPSDDLDLGFARPSTSGGRRTGGPRFVEGPDGVVLSVLHDIGLDDVPAFATMEYNLAGIEVDGSVVHFDGDPLEVGRDFEPTSAADGSVQFAGSALQDEVLRLALFTVGPGSAWTWRGRGDTDEQAESAFADVDLAQVGDALSIVGCNDRDLWSIVGTPEDFLDFTYVVRRALASDLVRCEVDAERVLTVDRRGSLATWAFAGDDLVPGEVVDGVTEVVLDAGGLLLVRDGEMEFEIDGRTHDLPTLVEPMRARFTVAPDGELYVVYADDDGTAAMVWGPPGGPYGEVVLDQDLASSDLDIAVTDTHVFVGTRSGDEVWVGEAARLDR